jgi:hypothetical protein
MTAATVLEIIKRALRRADDARIADVTTDRDRDGQDQLVITTDDGARRQVWIVDQDGLVETDDD